MLPLPVILMVGIVFLVLMMVVSGSLGGALVIFILAGSISLILYNMGYLSVKTENGGLDISFFETAPAPAPSKLVTPQGHKNIQKQEVFHISGNEYTYNDAPAVCAAYDSDLATQEQLEQAYHEGAEWCEYGWTQGGMALYPTQQGTWEALQREITETKRTGCGRPGVNGGYFDPDSKFGVNCYGVRPNNHGTKLPLPLPGTDTSEFNKMVDKFKSMMKKMIISPFNRTEWSELGKTPNPRADLSALKSSLDTGHNSAVTDLDGVWNSVSADASYGAKQVGALF
jgi:hypothetical protein